MISHQYVVVFEFDKLGAGEGAELSDNIVAVSDAAFAYLKRLCLCSTKESRFLSLTMADNCEVVQVKNYAGVVFTPDGTHIEILPKIGRITEPGTTRENAIVHHRETLLSMLKYHTHLHHLKTEDAHVSLRKMPLLEVFVSQFLSSVNTLVKRGLRSDYVACRDNLPLLKGKLQLSEHVKRNYINKLRFFVEFDEYLPDRPANRLIHSALYKVKTYCRSHENQKLLRELLFVFADVPVSQNIKSDFAAVRLDRGMAYYKLPLQWAKIVLDEMSPLAGKGDSYAVSLLFPMERVFEHFVASTLRKISPDNTQVRTQVASEYLVYRENTRQFQLKPDFKLSAGKRKTIMDTKWKLLNSSETDNHYGLSQSDFYQMYAYGQKYLKGEGDMYLIYPRHAQFTQPISCSFDFDDNSALKLWVIPFDCAADVGDTQRCYWPEKAESVFSVS